MGALRSRTQLAWPEPRRGRRHWSRRTAFRQTAGTRLVVVVGVVAAASLSVAMTIFSLDALVPPALAGLILGVALLARRGFARQKVPSRIHLDRAPTASGSERPDPFAVPRLFYFLGVLTITQLTFRLPGGLTVSDAFFFVSLLLALIVVLSTRTNVRDAVPRSGLWLGALMLTLGGLISSFVAENQVSSIATLLRLVYLTALWFLLGAVVLVRRRHVEHAVWLWVVSAAFTGLGAVVQYLFGDIIPSTRVVYGRMTGFTQHVNDLGGVTSIALAPAAMFVLPRSDSGRKRMLAVLCAGLISVGLLLSGSVGGMVAAAIAVVVFIAASREASRVLGVVAILGLVGAAAFAASTDGEVATPFKRFSTATGAEGSSRDTLATRVTTFREGWQKIRENPVIGTGLGPANGTLESGFVVHNMVLSPWVEAGLLGGIGMAVMLASVLGLARAAVRLASDPSERRMAVSLGSALAALIAFGMGAPVLFQRYGWIPAGLVIALVAAQSDTESPSPVAQRLVPARR